MREAEFLYPYEFTDWIRFDRRDDLRTILNGPGIYVIAKSKKSLSGSKFSWIKEIAYIGMTAGTKGLRGRLDQFEYTLSNNSKRSNHGGAHRVRSRHSNVAILKRYLYVSVMRQKPCPPDAMPQKRRKEINKVYRLELFCLAEYIRRYKKLPQFNDWASSPKKS